MRVQGPTLGGISSCHDTFSQSETASADIHAGELWLDRLQEAVGVEPPYIALKKEEKC